MEMVVVVYGIGVNRIMGMALVVHGNPGFLPAHSENCILIFFLW